MARAHRSGKAADQNQSSDAEAGSGREPRAASRGTGPAALLEEDRKKARRTRAEAAKPSLDIFEAIATQEALADSDMSKAKTLETSSDGVRAPKENEPAETEAGAAKRVGEVRPRKIDAPQASIVSPPERIKPTASEPMADDSEELKGQSESATVFVTDLPVPFQTSLNSLGRSEPKFLLTWTSSRVAKGPRVRTLGQGSVSTRR